MERDIVMNNPPREEIFTLGIVVHLFHFLKKSEAIGCTSMMTFFIQAQGNDKLKGI